MTQTDTFSFLSRGRVRLKRNIRRTSENTAGSCVGVSIKHQTEGSALGQYIAGCLFTSLPSHLLSLSHSLSVCVRQPSHQPPLIWASPVSHLSLAALTAPHPLGLLFIYLFILPQPLAYTYTLSFSLEMSAHDMLAALVARFQIVEPFTRSAGGK